MTHPTAVLAPAHPIVFGPSADAFMREVQACFDAGHVNVAVNLAAVPYIDSEGVRALLHGHALAERRHGVFLLVAPSPRIRQLLGTTHLNTVLQIHQSLDILDPAQQD